ncbi:rhodanese-like domain-containing protein [Mangrovivirga sp. M17]|uniref:Rhodanese-like domain-containing protein n=1 Tax=Mangrovivirga halotolerans TaxID=2993936 RepID=A0ABT3RR56_9BACT|nr:rhodanese-like domain-containing protein [Mangrovivirga halotolerans]MCX2744057.1 rhodanese-like domain-containing protein [Mangrovivirga halotolerans]
MFNLFNTKTKYKNVPATEFRKLMEKENTVLIDVRTRDEFKSGALPNALNYDFLSGEFASKISQLDKDKTYLIYCRSGARSANACRMLEREGFVNLYNLQGGIISY